MSLVCAITIHAPSVPPPLTLPPTPARDVTLPLLIIFTICIAVIALTRRRLQGAVFVPSYLSRITLQQRVVLIANGSSPIGLALALDMCQRGALVILGCKNSKVGRQAVAAVKRLLRNNSASVVWLVLDITSPTTVHPIRSTLRSMSIATIDYVLLLPERVPQHLWDALELSTDHDVTTRIYRHYCGAQFLLAALLLDRVIKAALLTTDRDVDEDVDDSSSPVTPMLANLSPPPPCRIITVVETSIQDYWHHMVKGSGRRAYVSSLLRETQALWCEALQRRLDEVYLVQSSLMSTQRRAAYDWGDAVRTQRRQASLAGTGDILVAGVLTGVTFNMASLDDVSSKPSFLHQCLYWLSLPLTLSVCSTAHVASQCVLYCCYEAGSIIGAAAPAMVAGGRMHQHCSVVNARPLEKGGPSPSPVAQTLWSLYATRCGLTMAEMEMVNDCFRRLSLEPATKTSPPSPDDSDT